MFPKKLPDEEHRVWTLSDCCEGQGFEYSEIFIHKNYGIGMHTHSFYEINIVVGGRGRHYIEENSTEAERGCVFVIPPNVRHGYYNEKSLDVLHIILFDTFFKIFDKELESLSGYRILFEIEPLIRSEYSHDLFLRLNDAKTDIISGRFNAYETLFPDGEGRKIVCNAVALEICVLLCRYASEYFNIKSVSKPSDKAVVRTLEYIINNLSGDVSVERLAGLAFLSKTAYERRFKALCGFTPMQYLLECRLSKVKELLKNEEISIARAAAECGFYDASHLNRHFKRKFGTTPMKYREKYAN